MAELERTYVWLDLNTNYDVDTNPELVQDIKAINNSLYNIFTTLVGTRPFLREYGSYLPYFLFQPMDKITEEDIRASLIQSVQRWEPRVVIDQNLTTVEALPNEVAYDVRLAYFVPSLQRPATFQFVARKL